MELLRTIRVADLADSFFAPRRNEVAADMVRTIIENVRKWGDESLFEYSAAFDKIAPSGLAIDDDDIRAAATAMKNASPDTYAALILARDNALRFARRQAECFISFECELSPGLFTGQKNIPLGRAGVYIPAGRFPLLSTVIMCLCPAIAAGVKEIVLCTPPRRHGDDTGYGIAPRPWADPGILAALALCAESAPAVNIKAFAVGGAQSVAAMCYGTQTVPPCDVIVGPGNKYVAEAKRQVSGYVGIDMIAGPTETFIIADESANPTWVAADMLAQAEHDSEASVTLVCGSDQFARAVWLEVKLQTEKLGASESVGNEDAVTASLARNGVIIVADHLRDAIAIANRKAPEHLELAMGAGKERTYFIDHLHNYGSLFIGHLSAEVLGDYSAGINHTLPTSSSARFTGGLSVRSFLKTVTTLRAETGSGTTASLQAAALIGTAEGLAAHAQAARERLDKKSAF